MEIRRTFEEVHVLLAGSVYGEFQRKRTDELDGLTRDLGLA